MDPKRFLLVCTTLACFYFTGTGAQGGTRIPLTRFTCQGRPSGYYADVETGCQVYHMCDGLGRQFSYTCPNTTLFQQRMLICDHWYMVNCTNSERDYDANLLIGQRDKPFVTDEEMQQLRTPRPDILSVPLNNNYYDGLKEAESKFPVHPGNNGVGKVDFSSSDNNELDSDNNYRPPSSSTTTAPHKHDGSDDQTNDAHDNDNTTGAAPQKPVTPVQSNSVNEQFQGSGRPGLSEPSKLLTPPLPPKTTTEAVYDIDVRMGVPKDDAVINFINRFDPDSPDSLKTSMTQTEIINLNKHLPLGQSSAEDERTPRTSKNFGNNFNFVQGDRTKSTTESSRFNAVNLKPAVTNTDNAGSGSKKIQAPERVLLPPKTDYSRYPSTTVGPPVYYEWKWAVPALDLELPKGGNETNPPQEQPQSRRVTGRSPFRDVTRTPPPAEAPTPKPINVEYNISSYFVPDYLFPLDEGHTGYEDENARTSFQVQVPKQGHASYGENPACPQCHPAYVVPGTCEPCIVDR